MAAKRTDYSVTLSPATRKIMEDLRKKRASPAFLVAKHFTPKPKRTASAPQRQQRAPLSTNARPRLAPSTAVVVPGGGTEQQGADDADADATTSFSTPAKRARMKWSTPMWTLKAELSAKIEEHEQEKAAHTTKIKEHAELKEKHEELMTELAAKADTHEELQKQHEELRAELAAKADTHEELQKQHEELRAELAAKADTHEELQKQHEELRAELAANVDTHEELKEKHEELTAHLAAKVDTHEQLKEKHNEITAHLAAKVNTHKQAAKELAAVQAEAAAAKAALQEQTRAAAKARERVQKLKARAEEAEESLRKTKREKVATEKALEETMAALRSAGDQATLAGIMQTEISALADEDARLKAQLHGLKHSLLRRVMLRMVKRPLGKAWNQWTTSTARQAMWERLKARHDKLEMMREKTQEEKTQCEQLAGGGGGGPNVSHVVGSVVVHVVSMCMGIVVGVFVEPLLPLLWPYKPAALATCLSLLWCYVCVIERSRKLPSAPHRQSSGEALGGICALEISPQLLLFLCSIVHAAHACPQSTCVLNVLALVLRVVVPGLMGRQSSRSGSNASSATATATAGASASASTLNEDEGGSSAAAAADATAAFVIIAPMFAQTGLAVLATCSAA